jgi:hypothetical protein
LTAPALIEVAGTCQLCRHWHRWAADSWAGNCRTKDGEAPLTRQDDTCDDYAYRRGAAHTDQGGLNGAPAPVEARERVVRAAVEWVYAQDCSAALAELEEAVTALIGREIDGRPIAFPMPVLPRSSRHADP